MRTRVAAAAAFGAAFSASSASWTPVLYPESGAGFLLFWIGEGEREEGVCVCVCERESCQEREREREGACEKRITRSAGVDFFSFFFFIGCRCSKRMGALAPLLRSFFLSPLAPAA